MSQTIERNNNNQAETLRLTNNQRARIERIVVDIVNEFEIDFMYIYDNDGYIALAFMDDMEILKADFEPSDLTMFDKVELKETVYNEILKDFKVRLS